MKKLILSLLLAASAFSAKAASIVLQSGSPALDIKLSTLQPLSSSGGGVVLGFFKGYTTAMNAQLSKDGAELRSFLADNFVPLGAPGSNVNHGANSAANPVSLRAIAGGGTTAAGTIENSTWAASTGAAPANSLQEGALVRGTRIFLLAYEGQSLAAATELGIFSASTWTIPAAAAVNTASFTLTQVNDAAEVYRGSLGSLVLAPIVPEPSTTLVTLLAGLGLISRRRR